MFINYKALQVVSRADFNIYRQIRRASLWVYDFEQRERKQKFLYRCHSLCRALASHFPQLTVVDGLYLGVKQVGRKNKMPMMKITQYPHTWLQTKTGHIIDPYPVGVISFPLLVPARGRWSCFGKKLYYPYPVLTPKFMTPKVRKETEMLTEHIGKLIKEHEKK